MSLDGINFDARFAKYEQYVKQASTEGRINLKGEAIGEQLGRYATGLQNAETKKQKKQFGKEYGRALAQERAEVKQRKQLAQKDKLAAKKAEISERLKTYNRNEVSGVVKADRRAAEIIAQNKEQLAQKDKFAAKKAEIRERLANDYNRNEVHGVVKADRRAAEIIAKNKKAAGEISKLKSANKSGFYQKITKAAKGKGKWGLVAAGVTLLGLGLYSLLKSDKKEDVKPVEIKPDTSAQKPVTPKKDTPATVEEKQKEPQAPVKDETPKEETPVNETPQAPVKDETPKEETPVNETPQAPVKKDTPAAPVGRVVASPAAPVRPEPVVTAPVEDESDEAEVTGKRKKREIRKQARHDKREVRKQARHDRREIRKEARHEISEIKKQAKQEIKENKQSQAA